MRVKAEASRGSHHLSGSCQQEQLLGELYHSWFHVIQSHPTSAALLDMDADVVHPVGRNSSPCPLQGSAAFPAS